MKFQRYPCGGELSQGWSAWPCVAQRCACARVPDAAAQARPDCPEPKQKPWDFLSKRNQVCPVKAEPQSARSSPVGSRRMNVADERSRSLWMDVEVRSEEHTSEL